MQNSTLCSLVRKYQSGSVNIFEEIYKEFKKLIIYYGSRLEGDESIQELNVFIVELLYKIPLNRFTPDDDVSLKKYIAVALRNKYIALSKTKAAYNRNTTELIEGTVIINAGYEDNIFIKAAVAKLSEKQKTAIYMRFIYNYSEIEISRHMEISRQAVNRLINRGLSLLRELYFG